MLDTGAYVFNTEAHPFDSGALDCCHGPTDRDIWEKAWFPKAAEPPVRPKQKKNDKRASDSLSNDSAHCTRWAWKSVFGLQSAPKCSVRSKMKPWSAERKQSPLYSLLTCDAAQFMERFCIGGEVCDL